MKRSRYSDESLGASEVRELRHLRDENAKLKRSVADLTLEGQRGFLTYETSDGRLPKEATGPSSNPTSIL